MSQTFGLLLVVFLALLWLPNISSFLHTYKPTKRLHSFLLSENSGVPLVAATRELGKNSDLLQELRQTQDIFRKCEFIELPCIEHAPGQDYHLLRPTLASKHWDFVVVTSPEAAKVLSSAWDMDRVEPIPVAAVGKATERMLGKLGIPVTFVPSKATAEDLANRLPKPRMSPSILYPASARAKSTLQTVLETRGFEVTRLNTYDTVTAQWSKEQKEKSKEVKVACFASPSSVEGWLQNTMNNREVVAACIGETSALACRNQGWTDDLIYYPESPSLEGWAHSIREALKRIKV